GAVTAATMMLAPSLREQRIITPLLIVAEAVTTVPKRGAGCRGPALRGDHSHRESGYLLVPWIVIVARRGRRGHAFGTRAMGPAPPSRKTLAATALETARGAIDLRLRSSDEGRQAIDADIIRDDRLRLWLRLKLRLRTIFAMAGVFPRLVGLPLALVVALVVVARHERLLLHRHEAGLLAEMRKIL